MSTRNVLSSPRTVLCALLALCACKTSKDNTTNPSASADPSRVERAQITSEVTAKAEVVAVNPATRIIALRREDGSLFQVMAGQDVRNFAQIKRSEERRVGKERRYRWWRDH